MKNNLLLIGSISLLYSCHHQSSICPDQPSGILNLADVKAISIDSKPIPYKGKTTVNKPLGYVFQAQAGQQLTIQKSDNSCLWIYSDDNQLITSQKLPKNGKYTISQNLPKNGKYTIEIMTIKENPEFTLTLSLSNLNIPKLTPSTIPASTPLTSSTTIVNPLPQPMTETEEIDKIADRIFEERYPELGGRKISSDEPELQQEWANIRRCEAIVDYLFYQRHPELGERKIQSDEYDLGQEWLAIRNSVVGCQ